MANLSSKTGTVTTPVQAQISLANNATTSVQDMSAYQAQEVTGFVYVDATADLRCSFKVMVVKNGADVFEIAAVDLAGDDYSGAPLLSFSMSGSVLRVTLPNITGFVAANSYLRYQLSAPYLGGNYPLSVDGSQVVSGTVGASFLPTAGAAAAGIMSTGTQTIAGLKTFQDGIVAPSTAVGTIYSGTYAPTITSVGGITIGTIYTAQYLRVNKVVTVSGLFIASLTGTANNSFTISVPVSRTANFSSGNMGGTATYARGGVPFISFAAQTTNGIGAAASPTAIGFFAYAAAGTYSSDALSYHFTYLLD